MGHILRVVVALTWLVTSVFALDAHNVSYTSFSYTGGDGDWLEGAGADQLTCPHRYTANPNVTFAFTFTGVAVELHVSRAPNSGQMHIILDDNEESIDTRGSNFICGANMYSKDNLTNTEHTINGSLIYAPGDYFNLNYLIYYTLDSSELASLSSSTQTATSNPSATGDTSQNKSSSSNTGPIVGGVVGGVVLVAFIAGLLLFLRRRKRRSGHVRADLDDKPASPTPWLAQPGPEPSNANTSADPLTSAPPSVTGVPLPMNPSQGATKAPSAYRPPTSLTSDGTSNASSSNLFIANGRQSEDGPNMQNLANMVAGIVMNQMNDPNRAGSSSMQEAPPVYTPGPGDSNEPPRDRKS